MERGPVALFGAIVAVGLGPALWLGAQFGRFDVAPPGPPVPVDRTHDANTQLMGGSGGGEDQIGDDNTHSPIRTKPRTHSERRTARPSATPSSIPTHVPSTRPSDEPSAPGDQSSASPSDSTGPTESSGGNGGDSSPPTTPAGSGGTPSASVSSTGDGPPQTDLEAQAAAPRH